MRIDYKRGKNYFIKQFGNKKLYLRKRIALYSASTMFLLLSPLSHAAPTTLGTGCFASVDSVDITFYEPSPSGFDAFFPVNDNFLHPGETNNTTYRHCHYSAQPTAVPDTMCDVVTTESEGTNYLALVNSNNQTYCLYQYDINLSAMPTRSNPSIAALAMPPLEPENVPIFSPLGLMVTLFGLLWFGKRRRRNK